MIAVEFKTLVRVDPPEENLASAIYGGDRVRWEAVEKVRGEAVAVAILPAGLSRADRQNFRLAMTGLLRVVPSLAGAAWGDGETVQAIVRCGTGVMWLNPRPYLGGIGCGAGDVLTVCRKILEFPVDRVVGPESHRERWEEAGVEFVVAGEYFGGEAVRFK